MAKYQLQLAHLYGNLLNTYGDLGNIMALKYYGQLLDSLIALALKKETTT